MGCLGLSASVVSARSKGSRTRSMVMLEGWSSGRCRGWEWLGSVWEPRLEGYLMIEGLVNVLLGSAIIGEGREECSDMEWMTFRMRIVEEEDE